MLSSLRLPAPQLVRLMSNESIGGSVSSRDEAHDVVYPITAPSPASTTSSDGPNDAYWDIFSDCAAVSNAPTPATEYDMEPENDFIIPIDDTNNDTETETDDQSEATDEDDDVRTEVGDNAEDEIEVEEDEAEVEAEAVGVEDVEVESSEELDDYVSPDAESFESILSALSGIAHATSGADEVFANFGTGYEEKDDDTITEIGDLNDIAYSSGRFSERSLSNVASAQPDELLEAANSPYRRVPFGRLTSSWASFDGPPSRLLFHGRDHSFNTQFELGFDSPL